MSALDILGFVVGSMDGAAGVSAAYQALETSRQRLCRILGMHAHVVLSAT